MFVSLFKNNIQTKGKTNKARWHDQKLPLRQHACLKDISKETFLRHYISKGQKPHDNDIFPSKHQLT